MFKGPGVVQQHLGPNQHLPLERPRLYPHLCGVFLLCNRFRPPQGRDLPVCAHAHPRQAWPTPVLVGQHAIDRSTDIRMSDAAQASKVSSHVWLPITEVTIGTMVTHHSRITIGTAMMNHWQQRGATSLFVERSRLLLQDSCGTTSLRQLIYLFLRRIV